MNLKKNLVSCFILIAFAVLAIGSSKINKIHCGAFNRNPNGEDALSGNYIVLNDGSHVPGQDVSWKSGLFVKDQIRIDDNKFPIRDTRGYFSNGIYYGRIGSGYAQRIVHGKLNVYYTETWVTSTSTSPSGYVRTTQRLVCTHYVQRGELGELVAIANQKDILEYVKDCPKAAEMINKKDRELRRAIRKNSMYLNEVFITFNNDCE